MWNTRRNHKEDRNQRISSISTKMPFVVWYVLDIWNTPSFVTIPIIFVNELYYPAVHSWQKGNTFKYDQMSQSRWSLATLNESMLMSQNSHHRLHQPVKSQVEVESCNFRSDRAAVRLPVFRCTVFPLLSMWSIPRTWLFRIMMCTQILLQCCRNSET